MSDALLPSGYEQALYRVATLASVTPTTEDVESLHAGLILQTLAGIDGPADPEAIRTAIRRSTGINLTLEAVVAAVGKVVADGDATRHPDFAVSLVAAKAAALKGEGNAFERMRRASISDWLDSLSQELGSMRGGSGLSAMERLHLEQDLSLFLLQLVRFHGAELALFLYPHSKRNLTILNVDDHDLFAEMPRRDGRLEDVRKLALPAFVREAKGARADLIAALLHRAALLQILQADATASAIFSEVIASKVLYLDTNFVFRVLGLQGDQLRASAREAMELGRQLGHTFRVSTTTFDELQNLVQRQASWLADQPELPRALAGAASEFIAGNDYVSTYWKERHERGASVQQFQAAHSQLSLFLENYEIQISKELVATITGTQELREACALLKPFKIQDPDLLIEHDALHKVLIENLRVQELGRPPDGWHEARFLFLTFDNRLPLYATRAAQVGKGHKIPFCLMGHEWLQLLYFARSDTAIPSDAFVALLNSPYLERYYSRQALNRDIVRDVVMTMGEMREMRPAVARKILAARTLTARLEATPDRKQRETLIRDAVRTEAVREDRRIADVVEGKDKQIDALEEKVRAKELEIGNLEKRLGKQEQTAQRHTERGKSGEARPQERRRLERERDALQEELTATRKQAAEVQPLAEGYRAIKAEFEALRTELVATKNLARRSERWLLLVPGLVAAYGLRRLAEDGPTGIVGWLALIVGSAPFCVGAATRFRGQSWEVVNRISSVLGILAFVGEVAPGSKALAAQAFHFLRTLVSASISSP